MTIRARVFQSIAAVALLTTSVIPTAFADAPSTLPVPWTIPASVNTPDIWGVTGFGCIGTAGTPGEVTVSFTDKNDAQVGAPITATVSDGGDWYITVTLDRANGDYTAHAVCDIYNSTIEYPALTVPASSQPAGPVLTNLLAGADTLTVKLSVDSAGQFVEISGTGCAVDGAPGTVTVTAKLPQTYVLPADSGTNAAGSWSAGYPAEAGHYHFEAVCTVSGYAASYQPLDFDLVRENDGTAVIAGDLGPAATTRSLANTGTNALALLPYAGLLLASGLGLLWVGRRRRFDS